MTYSGIASYVLESNQNIYAIQLSSEMRSNYLFSVFSLFYPPLFYVFYLFSPISRFPLLFFYFSLLSFLSYYFFLTYSGIASYVLESNQNIYAIQLSSEMRSNFKLINQGVVELVTKSDVYPQNYAR